MNKKIGAFFILLLAISFLPIASPQDVPGMEEAPLVGTIQNASERLQNISQGQNKSEYLKQEWRSFLEKKKSGQMILKASDFVKNFNPLFKVILGVEYSLSWAFLFAVVFWFILFLFLANPVSTILNNRLFGIIGSFVIASLIGLSGVIKKAVDLLSFILGNLWIALISFVIAIIIALLFEKLGKIIKNFK